MDLEKIKTDDFAYGLSKILEKQIKEIHGYVSTEFGEPTFHMSSIEFEDGTLITCEGDREYAYLAYNEKLDKKCQEIHKEESENG